MKIKTIPIDKDIKLTKRQKKNLREWIAALRSGEYHQACGQLGIEENNSRAFCCLGVACVLDSEYYTCTRDSYNLIFSAEGKEHYEVPDDARFEKTFGFESNSHLAGKLDDHCGFKTWTLPMLNDDLRLNFNYIADVIEAAVLLRKVVEIEIK